MQSYAGTIGKATLSVNLHLFNICELTVNNVILYVISLGFEM